MTAGARRKAILIAVVIGTAALLGWLLTSQGPLAPTRVTVAKVERGALVATTFGIGTVEARRAYAVGPTVASRVLRVLVDQGDMVNAGQLVAELDPVDLDDRMASGALAAERATHAVEAAVAQVAEAQSRERVATVSARRYVELRQQGFVSQEALDAKLHEASASAASAQSAAAQAAAARRDAEKARADLAGIAKLRAQTRLVSPVAGIVTARLIEPGATVVAGQAVVQLIDPASLWIRARIDQGQAGGLRAGQAAGIVLRSDPRVTHRGSVQRVDWVSDAVAEERIVNVGFDVRPAGVGVGDLAEVTIRLADIADARSVPSAAVKRVDRQDGVWRVSGDRVAFHPVEVGTITLDGRSQILAGLGDGETVIVHSEQSLRSDARVRIVPALVRAGS